MKFKDCKVGDMIKYNGPENIIFDKGMKYKIKSLDKEMQLIGIECGMMDSGVFNFSPEYFEKIEK